MGERERDGEEERKGMGTNFDNRESLNPHTDFSVSFVDLFDPNIDIRELSVSYEKSHIVNELF